MIRYNNKLPKQVRLSGQNVSLMRLNGKTVYGNTEYLVDGLMVLLKGNNKTNTSPTKTVWDNEGYEINPSCFGFAYTDQSGWTGQSLRFDGIDDRVLQSTDLSKEIFTIEGIFRKTVSKYGTSPFTTYSNDISKGFGFGEGGTGKFDKFAITYNGNTGYTDTGIDFLPNVKYSASITFNPATKYLYFYVNGNLVWSKNIPTLIPNKRYAVGRWCVYSFYQFFQGDIFCTRAYDRHLTKTDILKNYNIDKAVYGI